MTWRGIEPRSPGPLANTLPTRPILNCAIWSINGILTGTIILGESGPVRDDNEDILHITQTSR